MLIRSFQMLTNGVFASPRLINIVELDRDNFLFISAEESVVARLWPFLSDNSTSVRKATLQALVTLTSQKVRVASWGAPLLTYALRHVFQRALTEPVQQAQVLVEQVT